VARPETPLVTPEAVVLELETAGVASRLVAILLDLLVVAAGISLVSFVLTAAVGVLGAPDWVAVVALVLVVFVGLFGYPCLCESLTRGRTIGKAAVGLRVVTVDGAPIRFRHAALRAILGLVDFWLPPGGAVAILTVLGTSRDQRLGDIVAGTVVLQERRAAAGAVGALWFTAPPALEGLVASLDTAALTADDERLARTFLLRAPAMAIASRAAIGAQVRRRLAARVGVLPPPGVHDEWFVTCVVVAQQRRRHAEAQRADTGVWWPWADWRPSPVPAPAPVPPPAAFAPPG
jgi:uncharacterized RDD family membrane protein YckC